MADDETVTYFNEHCEHYNPGRINFAAHWIAEHIGPEASVVDLGCGTGALLERVVHLAGVSDVLGVDPSEIPLAAAAERLGCPTHVASILDPDLDRLPRRFDVALVVAVLHHLVGRSRRESFALAGQAVRNAAGLLEPGGYVVVHEPVFYPRAVMWLVFHLKRLLTRFTSRRLTFGDHWHNLGAPVVSYLTNEQLDELVAPVGRIVAREVLETPVHPLMRLAGIRRRCNTTLIVQRPS